MKKTVIAAILVPVMTVGLFSQPLNGSYTIGGSNPDFVTLQDAANALKGNGVSGSVFFNIRPGTYSENGGNNSVLVLDSTVAGLSSSNRITFQPDEAEGGDVDNVILEMNVTDPGTADSRLVLISLDFVSFHNITFREADGSLLLLFNRFVELTTSFYNSPFVEDIEFVGCKFIGTDPSNTEIGIIFSSQVKEISIRENMFIRLRAGVEGSGFANENIVIESNQFIEGWFAYGGSGSPYGAAIQVYGQNIIIKKNTVDFTGSSTGGYLGIYVNVVDGGQYIIIAENLFRGFVSQVIYLYGYGGAQADSTYIANNMIYVSSAPVWPNESGYGLRVTAGNVNIVFNTMVVWSSGVYGVSITGDDCKVLNNIFINRMVSGFNVGYYQGNTQAMNLRSDFNVIYAETDSIPGGLLVISDGVFYYSLADYQNTTSLDTNSLSRDIEFVALDDLHLTECQSQDPELRGIPIDGITIDIDEDIRNETSPLMGADESDPRMNDMFGNPFVAALPGTAFSIASAPFDNLLADGLAVPDYDNNQVLLFHYTGNGTFTNSGTIPTMFPPTVVGFHDIDLDNYLDLIIGYEANWLQIHFGDGTGGFPTNVLLDSPGHVRSMAVGNDNLGGNPRVFLTIDDSGFPARSSYMGYIDSDNGPGNIDVALVRKAGSLDPDTIYSVMDDIAVANLDSEPNDEIVALAVGVLGEVYIYNDTTISGDYYAYGTHYRHVYGNVASYGTSSIHIDDFDGDGDKDFVATGYDSDELVLLRNSGNLVFADEEIITRQTDGFVVMDYENDGDKDIVTMNERLETNGITVFLNNGFGNFVRRENCYFPYANGAPWSIIASDFDLDGRTDIAITSTTDSLYVLYNLGGGVVGLQSEQTEAIPSGFALAQNFPNPFNPTTTIQYSLPRAGTIRLTIHNVLGEEVETLVDEYMPAGKYSVQFDASRLASGVYFYRLNADDFVETRKMILMK